MITAADVLAFTVELVAVGAVTAWGWRAGGWPGAAAALLGFAAVWGTFLSPRAALPVTGSAWSAAASAVFTLSALALGSVAGILPAAAFLTVALLSVLLGGPQ